ncbi:hypothetical protein [Roseibium album]|uniref:hypothetical protein n=1 Tax=Roseibium album TaxID=311410 RepID=UPI00391ACD4C
MDFDPEQNAVIMTAYAQVSKEIKDGGCSWRIEKDFEKVREEIEAAGKELTPFFWTNYFDFNGQNAFCLVLEKDGQGLSYICIQRFELGSRTLEQAYLQRLKSIYAHDREAKLDSSWTCEPLQEVTGTIAYSGDAVTHGDLRSLGKSRHFLSAISKLSLYLALITWSEIGWIVGTINEKDIGRGLGWLYGGARCYPMAERWEVLPEKRRANYAVVLSSRRDVLWNARCALLATHQSEQQELKEIRLVAQTTASETGE